MMVAPERTAWGNPTLNPSPQGGGRRWHRVQWHNLGLALDGLPSPLWGGIEGGGVFPRTLVLESFP